MASRYECRWIAASDAPALRRMSDRFRDSKQAQYASWPLDVVERRLPGAPPADDFPVRYRVAVVANGDEIRAQRNLLEHEVFLHGKAVGFGWDNGPLSEGLLSPRYAHLNHALHAFTLRHMPFQMGITTRWSDYAKVAEAKGRGQWTTADIPFFFHVVRINRFLRLLPRLRGNRAIRAAATLARASGLAWLGYNALSTLWRTATRRRGITWRREDAFGPWADTVWNAACADYGAVSRRDTATLRRLYQPGDRRLHVVRVWHHEREVGWVVVTRKAFRDDPYLGDLTAATIVDGFAATADLGFLAQATRDYCATLDVDLVIGNFSHGAWRRALRRQFFTEVDSGLILLVSPAGQAHVLNDACPIGEMHLSRGDNDGPERFMEPKA